MCYSHKITADMLGIFITDVFPITYTRDYLYMLGLKLNHVSKSGPLSQNMKSTTHDFF